ncbi:hypothetical protein PHYC_02927 [Phycisphaerales bacterium]|nr:hypothetical protein PHYC_02927 [Phycisphaerales bacterium]
MIIPTFDRPAKAAACLRALAPQARDCDTEVLLGVDGKDPRTAGAAADAWISAGGSRDRLRVEEGDKAGQAAVRNRLLPLARGHTLVFLNDDMIPQAGFIEAHLRAQEECEGAGTPVLVEGRSPWVIREPDSLISRMIRETSMVFFHDVMDREADRDRDWGFRHAWLLNLSAPAALMREAGGFTVFPSTYGYEDDELAFRLRERFSTRVLYRPGAVALHDHAMTAREYLEREYKLGYAAFGFASAAPECARAMFGRDLTGAPEKTYCGLFTANERRFAAALLASFLAHEHEPANTADRSKGMLTLLYQHHLPLKRWMWRKGLADAADGVPMNPAAAISLLNQAS